MLCIMRGKASYNNNKNQIPLTIHFYPFVYTQYDYQMNRYQNSCPRYWNNAKQKKESVKENRNLHYKIRAARNNNKNQTSCTICFYPFVYRSCFTSK